MNRARRSLLSSVLAGAGAAFVGKAKAQENEAFVPARVRSPLGYTPVKTLNGETLDFEMKDGVKEFRLVAEEIEH